MCSRDAAALWSNARPPAHHEDERKHPKHALRDRRVEQECGEERRPLIGSAGAVRRAEENAEVLNAAQLQDDESDAEHEDAQPQCGAAE